MDLVHSLYWLPLLGVVIIVLHSSKLRHSSVQATRQFGSFHSQRRWTFCSLFFFFFSFSQHNFGHSKRVVMNEFEWRPKTHPHPRCAVIFYFSSSRSACSPNRNIIHVRPYWHEHQHQLIRTSTRHIRKEELESPQKTHKLRRGGRESSRQQVVCIVCTLYTACWVMNRRDEWIELNVESFECCLHSYKTSKDKIRRRVWCTYSKKLKRNTWKLIFSYFWNYFKIFNKINVFWVA